MVRSVGKSERVRQNVRLISNIETVLRRINEMWIYSTVLCTLLVAVYPVHCAELWLHTIFLLSCWSFFGAGIHLSLSNPVLRINLSVFGIYIFFCCSVVFSSMLLLPSYSKCSSPINFFRPIVCDQKGDALSIHNERLYLRAASIQF